MTEFIVNVIGIMLFASISGMLIVLTLAVTYAAVKGLME